MRELRVSNLDFAHLHVHTEYSMLDGLSRLDELVAQAQQYGMTSMAIMLWSTPVFKSS